MIKKRPRNRILDAQECAILLLLLIGSREGTTKVRLSEITLKRLWGRHRLKEEFLEEVREWLIRGGWSLFYARNTFGAVRNAVVENWPRLSSKRLADVLKQVEEGVFEFDEHTNLVTNPNDTDTDD
jgi:hypothetical protein